jgi:hypothetical protein
VINECSIVAASNLEFAGPEALKPLTSITAIDPARCTWTVERR